MGSVQIIVVPPVVDDLAGMAVAGEQVLVEAFVSEPPIEAFHEAVLHGFPRRDVMPFDAAILLPSEDGIAGQLGTVVADHQERIAAMLSDGIQFSTDALA